LARQNVVFGPAELVEIKGEPNYDPIAGTGLEYVSNTTANIFRFGGEHYILLSGCWFKLATLDGPLTLTFVTAADIPPTLRRFLRIIPKPQC
jgi:hypothetical protein